MRTPPSRTSERFPPRGVTGNQNKSSVHARPGQPVNLIPGSASYSYSYNVNRFHPFQAGAWCQGFFTGDPDFDLGTGPSATPTIPYWYYGPGPTAFYMEQAEPAHHKGNETDPDNEADLFGEAFVFWDPPGPPWLAPAGDSYTFGEYQETSSTDTIGGGTGTTNNVTAFSDPHAGNHEIIDVWLDYEPGDYYYSTAGAPPPPFGFSQIEWSSWTALPPGDFSGPAKAEIADTMGFRITFDRFGNLQIFIDPGWLYWATTKLTFYAFRMAATSQIDASWNPSLIAGGDAIAFSNGYDGHWLDGYAFDRNLPVDWYRFSGAGQNGRLQSFSPVSRGPAASILMTDQFQLKPLDITSLTIPVVEQTVVAKSAGYSGNISNLNDIVLNTASNASPPSDTGFMMIFPLRLEIDISGLKIPDWLIARLPLVVRNAGFQAI